MKEKLLVLLVWFGLEIIVYILFITSRHTMRPIQRGR